MSDFEREMEQELRQVLDPMVGGPVPARAASQVGGTMKRKVLGGAGAALGAKLAVGFAVAAFAAAGVTVASTGSLNPADWGQQVKNQVATCKTTLRASGVRGIGECVSDFAQQHGKLVSGSHASGARVNDGGHGNGNANGHDKDKGHGKDRK